MNHKVRYSLKEREHNAKKFKLTGTACLRQGKFKEAVDQYRLATIFNPHLKTDIILDYERMIYLDFSNLAARFSLANFYLSVSDKDCAIEELEDILEINPYMVEVYNLLGKMYLEESRTEDCIRLLERALNRGIDDLSLIETLAGAYLEKNMLRKATTLYEELLKFEGKNKKLLRILGDLYCRQGRYEEASSTYTVMLEGDAQVIEEVRLKLEEIRSAAPENLAVLERLAEAYVKDIKPSRALEVYQDILKLNPDHLDKILSYYRRILSLYPSHPETILALAQSLTQKGQYSESAQMYEKVVRFSPELADKAIRGYKEIISLYPGQILAHQLLAAAYLAQNKIEEAIFEFNKLLELNPQDPSFAEKKAGQLLKDGFGSPSLHLLLGRAYFLKGDYLHSQAEVEIILNQDPKNIAAHLLLGQIYQKMKLYDQSLAALNKALELNPYNPEAHQIYALVSKEHLDQQIFSLSPKTGGEKTEAEPHYNLGNLYFAADNLESAIVEFQTASLDPEFHLPSLEALVKCFILQNRFDLAATQLKKIIKTKSHKFLLGLCRQAMGNLPSALKLFNEIYGEDASFPALKERLQYLKKIPPSNLKNKSLICLLASDVKTKKLAAWWGPDLRPQRLKGAEALGYSFGQSHDASGFENFLNGAYQAAEEEFLLASQIDTHLISAINNLGVAYLFKGEPHLAHSCFQKAYDIDADSSVVINNLGVAACLQGDLKEAEKLFLKAVAANRYQSVSDVNLGFVLYQNGSIKEALLLWEKYLEHHLVSEFVGRLLRYKKV